jgi:hypothetical protein
MPLIIVLLIVLLLLTTITAGLLPTTIAGHTS